MHSTSSQSKAFALFSEPGSNTFKLIHCEPEQVIHLHSHREILGKSGFLFSPFYSKINHKIFFPGEAIPCGEWPWKTLSFGISQPTEKGDFTGYVNRIQQKISKGTLDKCVASRTSFQPLNNQICIWTLLQRCRKKYPETWISAVFHPSAGLWVTASPELLVRSESHYAETVALAGTRTKELSWTDKEKKEQDFVTQYIVEKIPMKAEVSELQEIQTGELFHLFRHIRWATAKDEIAIAENLHPTPALCGTPPEQALNLILEEEGNNREYFSGYQGYQNEERSVFYVTIRCARIFDNGIRYHAGAGITAESDPDKEYAETEKKINILKTVVSSCR